MVKRVERRSIENRFKAFALQIVQSANFTEIGRFPDNCEDGDDQTEQCLQQNVGRQQTVVLLFGQSKKTPVNRKKF